MKCIIRECAHLCFVSDKVNFRFGWLRGRRRWDVDLRCLIRFLDKHVDERLLFGGRRNSRYVRYGWWWRCWCFDEYDFVVFLWGWWWLHWFLRSIVRGLWWRHVHVHVLVYDRRLLGGPILRWRAPARVWSATNVTSADRRRVAVQRQSRKPAATETGQRSFGSAQASTHCQQHL